MCGIKTRQQRAKLRVVKVVLGMCNLKPVNMLHSKYLPTEHAFVSIAVLEGPDERRVHVIQLLLCLHVSFLVILDVLHALLDNLPEAFEVHVEVTLHWCCILLYHFFY